MANPIVDLPGEIWKPVVGREGMYEVSNMGRVRSWCWHGRYRRGVRVSEPRVLAQYIQRDPKGRIASARVGIPRTLDKAVGSMLVHVLVLEAFVGPRPRGMDACHNDGNPTNNKLSNLRWDTRKANLADAARHGTLRCGEANHASTMSNEQARRAREQYAAGGVTVVGLARNYGIDKETMRLLLLGMRYKGVGGPIAATTRRGAK